MKLYAFAAAFLLVLSASAGAQDAVRPCKPARQASRVQPTDAQPGAQEATGTPQNDQSRQVADATACEEAPPTTR